MSNTQPDSRTGGRTEGPLPLAKAYLAWCDPGLVAAYEEAAALPMPPPIFRRRTWGADWSASDWRDSNDALRADAFAAKASAKRREVEGLQRQRLQSVLADFRERVGRGEIVLVGLQVEPAPATARAAVPAAWASRMRLELSRGRITMGAAVFVDVVAERRTLAAPDPPAAASVGAAEHDDKAVVPSAGSPRRKPGPESSNGVIRDALQRRWAEVQAETLKAPSGRPNLSSLARRIHKDLARTTHKTGAGKVPHQSTIRRNLPSIYDQMLRESGCENSKPPE